MHCVAESGLALFPLFMDVGPVGGLLGENRSGRRQVVNKVSSELVKNELKIKRQIYNKNTQQQSVWPLEFK